MDWPLAEAKNKFSEVFERALKEGPQRISRRGKDRVVVISEEQYRRSVSGQRKPKEDFIAFLLSARGLGPIEPPDREDGSGRASARRVRF
jgi:prevent-host-death family protein